MQMHIASGHVVLVLSDMYFRFIFTSNFTSMKNYISFAGIEILLIGRFPPLISYLKARSYPKIQIAALKV